MTHILAIAIVLLVFSFYISTFTLIFPLTFPYLLLIFALKDIPKSKFSTSLLVLGILGTLLSLLAPELTLLHEVIVLCCVMICAWIMDTKSFHGILSGLGVVVILPLAQTMRIEKNQFGSIAVGFLLLLIVLYYFFYHFNLYLSDIEINKTPMKMHHFSLPTKIGLSIILLIATLGIYQELMMNLSQQSKPTLFIFEQTKFDARVRYERPINIETTGSGISTYSHNKFKTDAFYFDSSLYQYDIFDIEIGFMNPESRILNLNLVKKKDAPETINTNEFKLSDYYEVWNYAHENFYPNFTFEHVNRAYQRDTLYIDILGANTNNVTVDYWSHPISSDTKGNDKRIILAYEPKPYHQSGRSLLMRVDWIWYPNIDAETPINTIFSPFVEPIIYEADKIEYTLKQTNKNTQETRIACQNEWQRKTDSSFKNNFDRHFFCYLELPKTPEFEKYDYTFEITFFKNEKAIFNQEAVILP